MENMAINEELYNNISTVFSSVIAGDWALNEKTQNVFFEDSGTKFFLDNLVKTMPGVFKDRDFIIGLIYNMVRLDKRKSLYDDWLYMLFSTYVDKSLWNDGEVVFSFLEVFCTVYEDEDRYSGWEPSLPQICFDVPHETIMDPQIFNLLLKTQNPAIIYQELLTPLEKRDEHILFKILLEFDNYRCRRTPDTNVNDYKEYIETLFKELQEEWLESIDTDCCCIWDKLHDIQKSELITWNGNNIYEFFKTYFNFLSQRKFLSSYNGVEPKTIREKSDLYLQYLIDANISEDDLVDDDNYNSDNPYTNKSLLEFIKEYWYSICLFGAIGIEDSNMLINLCGGYVKNGSEVDIEEHDIEGTFMNIPQDSFDPDFPFC